MSLDARPNSALFKRAEQLKRWNESLTNRESSAPRDEPKRIQFSMECVFLAACACGDKEEVLRLLNVGADIDTSNVDGLSALHQACIDDNLDMVEFLLEHGADVNKGDNEGWTPLHATASCGFISIANYLIEHGADVAAVNNDGELAVDIAESDEMEDLLHSVLKEKGINLEEARKKEETIMLKHAREWLDAGTFDDIPHEKTGATALHVAASKGYIKVLNLLLQAGADVNAIDYDGWTPLHAAAHWGQREACEILVQNGCDMNKKNYVGQTSFDVSEGEMVRLLEDLQKKQSVIYKENLLSSNLNIIQSPKRRFSDNDSKREKNGRHCLGSFFADERNYIVDKKVPKVDKENVSEHQNQRISPRENVKTNSLTKENNVAFLKLPETDNSHISINSVPPVIPLSIKSVCENEDTHTPLWRKPIAGASRNPKPQPKLDEKAASCGQVNVGSAFKTSEVVLRRTQSFETDVKFYRRYCELKARIESGNTCPALTNHTNTVSSCISQTLKNDCRRNDLTTSDDANRTTDVTSNNDSLLVSARILPTPTAQNLAIRSDIKNVCEQNAASSPTAQVAAKLSTGNIFKNFFKSFVPPVRDEESETQRKAHAKRVRETRRSTQGVTLEELKSAEQLVKKKQLQLQLQQNCEPGECKHQAGTVCSTGSMVVPNLNFERRPSWRLKVDSSCKFQLEDVRVGDKSDATVNGYAHIQPEVTSSIKTSEIDDSVVLPLRKTTPKIEPDEDGRLEQQASQAEAANSSRRKRTKRRSTGCAQVDLTDVAAKSNLTDSGSSGCTNISADLINKKENHEYTSSKDDVIFLPKDEGVLKEKISNDLSTLSSPPLLSAANHDSVLDFKQLYEEVLVENELLKKKLLEKDDELQLLTVNNPSTASNKNEPNSENEKREKRAIERKLSEMEEELKLLEQMKIENQRLKDENGALIRVISKLSK